MVIILQFMQIRFIIAQSAAFVNENVGKNTHPVRKERGAVCRSTNCRISKVSRRRQLTLSTTYYYFLPALPTFNSLLSTSYFPLSTSNFLLPTFHFQLSTFNFQLSTSNFPLSTFHFQLATSYFLLATSRFAVCISMMRSFCAAIALIAGGKYAPTASTAELSSVQMRVSRCSGFSVIV